MGEVLEALQRLQEIELQLAEIRRDRDSKVRRVELHARRVRVANEEILTCQNTIRTRQVRLDALQLDVTARETEINKHRQALNQAKTNKEYAAILAAMNTEKADNSKFETEILRLMDEIQKFTDQVSDLQDKKSKLAEEHTRAEKAVAAFDAEHKVEYDELGCRRTKCGNALDPLVLAMFNRVAEHHDGEALAMVDKLHPRRDDYICCGCNLKITLEVVNALQTRDEVQLCKVCGRILFLDVPTKQRSPV